MPTYINALGTAVPEYCFEEATIADFMVNASQLSPQDTRKLKTIYRNTRIHTRFSVLEDYGRINNFTFYPNTPDFEPFPSVSQRMAIYRQEALPLALKAVHAANIKITDQITHLITVSCTGMYAPGLDIELVQALGLPYYTQRTCINFMGCYGAFNGLKMAHAIVNADKNAKVLLVCVELCTLHFQKKTDENYLLSNALFADGAAAVLIEGTPKGIALQMNHFYCDLLPEGSKDMAWQIGDLGFEMVLSAYIPKLVKGGLEQLMNRLKSHAVLPKIDFYAIHPGGRAILEAAEQQLQLTPEDNRYAYKVLREYGNMSSCTVLFVLQQLMYERSISDHGKTIFSCAFGPGLTLETGLFEIVAS